MVARDVQKLEYGRWYCELSSEEACRVFDFFNMKHIEYLFSIDMKFENNLNDNIIGGELMNTFESCYDQKLAKIWKALGAC